ncbi:hypothetical protein [Roseibium sp.]|uniref:hypothetical protein n=1 Tax=Roseibium sp. TaxID=1936156 RepID=UPI003D0DD58B
MIFINYSSPASHSFKTRARLLSLSTALALISGSALAQDTGEAAFRAYVDGLRTLGIDVENGAIAYDAGSDTLTITDTTVTFGGTLENLPAETSGTSEKDETDSAEPAKTKDLTYRLSMSAGALTITGLTHEDGAFTSTAWTYSDDAHFSATGDVGGEGGLKIDGRLRGVSAANFDFTLPEVPADDPKHQASRWLPFLQASLLNSYDEFRIDNSGMTIEAFTVTDGKKTVVLAGTVQMDGYRMANAEDGRIGEYTIDRVTQELQTLDLDSGRMLTQTTSQGKTHYEDIDAAALVDLLDPAVPETGDEVTLIRTGSTVDYKSSQEIMDGLSVEVSMDKASITDVTVTKRDNNVLALFDQLLDDQVPAPEELITNVFQFYRSFGIADARISGISIKVPTPMPDQTFGVDIREMAMTDVNSDGIGEMMIVGLDAPKLPEGGSMKLDWAAIGDIEFAEYTPMRAMISTLMADPEYGDKHPLEVARAFMPRSFGYEVEGLDVNLPDVGRTKIGKAELTVSTTVPPIPTSFYVKNDGIQVPVSTIEEREARELFEALGLDTVVWSDETRLYWDEATLELRLEKLMLNIDGLGRAEASARFANVPKALFEDPEGQGQMAAISAQFVDASIVYRDDGLTSKGLAHIAEQQGIPENVFREAMIAQAGEATAPIGNAAFTRMVSDAASRFLNDPKELKVTLTPANPVPLAQILGSMAAPQTLPDLLNVKITAN